MEKTSETMTAERSLEIINRMLEQSRRDITRGIWRSFLLWGGACVVIALGVGHLWEHTALGGAANVLWSLLGLVALAEWLLGRRARRCPRNFLADAICKVWTSMGIVSACLGILLGILYILDLPLRVPGNMVGQVAQPMCFPITAVIIMLMGMSGVITGRLLRSRVITVCSLVAGVAGSVSATVCRGPYEMVVFAAVALVGMVVPGLIIRWREAR